MPGFPWRKEKSPVMPRARKYPEELLERGTRLVFGSGRPIAHVAVLKKPIGEASTLLIDRELRPHPSSALGIPVPPPGGGLRRNQDERPHRVRMGGRNPTIRPGGD